MKKNVLKNLVDRQLLDVGYTPIDKMTKTQKAFNKAMTALYYSWPDFLVSQKDDLAELLSNYPGNISVSREDNIVHINHQHMGISVYFQPEDDADNLQMVTVIINDKLRNLVPDIIVLAVNADGKIVVVDDRSKQHPEVDYPPFGRILRPVIGNEPGELVQIQTMEDLAEVIRDRIAHDLI